MQDDSDCESRQHLRVCMGACGLMGLGVNDDPHSLLSGVECKLCSGPARDAARLLCHVSVGLLSSRGSCQWLSKSLE